MLDVEFEKYNEEILSISNFRAANKFAMDNTVRLCFNNGLLKSSIDSSIIHQRIIDCDETIDVEYDIKATTNIIVSKKRTLEAAKQYINKKVAVLNFANNHSIGGSPWYAGAQEESMCRCSTLYPCLYNLEEDFYEKHIELFFNRKIDNYGNDDMIYTPNITVFKTNNDTPIILDPSEWYNVDVISAAAPELQNGYEIGKLEPILTRRIERILQIAKKGKVEVLILGAFGCGAFNNPPKLVASIFKNLLKKYYFDLVEFAVFCRDDNPGNNYYIFNEIINNN